MSPRLFAKNGSTQFRLAVCGAAALTALLSGGCQDNTVLKLRQEVAALQKAVAEKDNLLVAQKATIDEQRRQLDVARSISEDDLKKVFYPDRLVIDRLSGGENYDNQPGDDGVTVYLRPIDRDGDIIKVAGDITIQLYDLAAPPQRNFIGEYKIPVDQVGKLWHGKLWTDHYAIKCPWPPSGPPAHPEVTIRAVFVDYLTKRVVSAQATCTVRLPP